MILLEILSWALFGLIIGAFVDWFLRRRGGRTTELLLVGTVAGLAGGFLGFLFPGGEMANRGYDLLSLLLACVAAALAVWIDWTVRLKHRPGSVDPHPTE